MNSDENSRSNPPRGRAAWAAGAVALVLAGGGWLLSRRAEEPRAAVVTLAPSTPAPAQQPPVAEAKPEAAAAVPLTAAPITSPAATPAPAVQPGASPPTGLLDAAMRKVAMALEGHATPGEMLEAAEMLSACQGADMAVDAMYKQRDQPSPVWQQLQKSSGFSSEEQIKQQQDFQRRCQVFDAATLARRGELLKGAYDGGAKDSALPYLQWLNASKQEVNPELRGKLQREARQTVEEGDFMALMQYSYAFNPAPLGITELQRQAYKEAAFRIQGETSGAGMEKAARAMMDDLEKNMAKWGALPPPLTAEQQREADALAAKVVAAWRKRQGKGG